MTAAARAAAGKRTCATCGDRFIGRSGASYCGPACRKRAQRARSGKRDNKCDIADVTDKAQSAGRAAHSAEALAFLAALDAELADVSGARGQTLGWSAQDEAIRELIACAVDREVWLRSLSASSDDVKLQMKVSAELRLTEAHRARLIRQIKTDLPPAPSVRSRKAQRAARARWDRGGA